MKKEITGGQAPQLDNDHNNTNLEISDQLKIYIKSIKEDKVNLLDTLLTLQRIFLLNTATESYNEDYIKMFVFFYIFSL